MIRLSHDYTYDVGSLHVTDYYLHLASKILAPYGGWYVIAREPIQRDHDEEISGAYR